MKNNPRFENFFVLGLLLGASILFVIPFFWFHDPFLFLWGDEGALYFLSPQRYIEKAFYCWSHYIAGVGAPDPFMPSALPFASIIWLLQKIGLTPSLCERAFWGGTLAGAFVFTSLFLRDIFGRLNRFTVFLCFFSGIVFLLSGTVILTDWTQLSLEIYLLVAFPALIFFYYRYLKWGKMLWLFLGSGIAFFFSVSLQQVPWVGGYIIGCFIFILTYWFLVLKSEVSLVLFVRRTSVYGLSVLWVNGFWIFPACVSWFFQPLMGETGEHVVQASHNVLFLAESLNVGDYLLGLFPQRFLMQFSQMQNFHFWIYRCKYLFTIIPLLIGIAHWVARGQQRKILISLSLPCLCLLYFSTVNVGPGGVKIFVWLVDHIPGWFMYRNFYNKFPSSLAFFYALLLGYSLFVLVSRFGSWARVIQVGAFCLWGAFLIRSLPFIKGEVVERRIHANRNERTVTLFPHYFKEACQDLNGFSQGGILSLPPLLQTGWGLYRWGQGFQGHHPAFLFLDKPFFDDGWSFGPLELFFREVLKKGRLDTFKDLLRWLDITCVWYPKDFNFSHAKYLNLIPIPSFLRERGVLRFLKALAGEIPLVFKNRSILLYLDKSKNIEKIFLSNMFFPILGRGGKCEDFLLRHLSLKKLIWLYLDPSIWRKCVTWPVEKWMRMKGSTLLTDTLKQDYRDFLERNDPLNKDRSEFLEGYRKIKRESRSYGYIASVAEGDRQKSFSTRKGRFMLMASLRRKTSFHPKTSGVKFFEFTPFLLGETGGVLQDDKNIAFDARHCEFNFHRLKSGLAIQAYFDGPFSEDEYVNLGISFSQKLKNKPVPINLRDFPYLAVAYRVAHPRFQRIQVAFRTHEDSGKGVFIVPAKKYEEARGAVHKTVVIDLLKAAQDALPNRKDYFLNSVHVLCQKIGRKRVSKDVGKVYPFFIYQVALLQNRPLMLYSHFPKGLTSTESFYEEKKGILIPVDMDQGYFLDGKNLVRVKKIHRGISLENLKGTDLFIRKEDLKKASQVKHIFLCYRSSKDARLERVEVPNYFFAHLGRGYQWIIPWRDVPKIKGNIEAIELDGGSSLQPLRWRYRIQGVELSRGLVQSAEENRDRPEGPLLELDGKIWSFTGKNPENLTFHKFEGREIVLGPIEMEEGIHHLKFFKKGLNIETIAFFPEEIYRNMESGVLNVPKVDFHQIDPTRYEVSIENLEQPFWLVLMENYNAGWKAFACKDGFPGSNRYPLFHLVNAVKEYRTKFEIPDHIKVNNFANGWWIDPKGFNMDNNNHSESKNLKLVLEFIPQRYLELGLLMAGGVLAGIMFFLLGGVWMKRHSSSSTNRDRT
ncbi:MAG: hypothetical protein HYZ66_06205 [Chlamydiae bacterium]|nr:hypothetical protein [Chlamydiota bacterium]